MNVVIPNDLYHRILKEFALLIQAGIDDEEYQKIIQDLQKCYPYEADS